MTDFTQYQVPGVYVQDVSQPLITAASSGGGVVCVVGLSAGKQSAIESLPLFSTRQTILTHPGAYADGTLVVKKLNGTVLTIDVDYAVTSNAPAHTGDQGTLGLNRLAAGGDPTATGVASPGGVADGDLVQVSYTYTDDDFFTPQIFQAGDYDLLAATYGAALATGGPLAVSEDSQVLSNLTLGAQIAFENGAPAVMAIAVDVGGGTIRNAFKAAYDQVLTDPRVSIIVPVPPHAEINTGTKLGNYISDLRTHCNAAAADGFGRIGIVGGSQDFDETATPLEDVAAAATSKRIVLVYPTRFNIFNSGTSQVFEVDGSFAGAALAGSLAFNPVARGLTRQVVSSFAGLPGSVAAKMTSSFMNNLSSKGVCVIAQDRTSRLVARHGLTTDMSALNTREISLVRVADTLLDDLQSGLDNSGLIGQPIDIDMPTRVKGVLTGILEQDLAADVIAAYGNVLVRQQSLPTGDPSVIDCKFDYAPAVPLNYITVEFSINLTTGTVETQATQALSA